MMNGCFTIDIQISVDMFKIKDYQWDFAEAFSLANSPLEVLLIPLHFCIHQNLIFIEIFELITLHFAVFPCQFSKSPTLSFNMFYTKLCRWVTAKNSHWLNYILPRINKIHKKKKKKKKIFICICALHYI